MNTKEFMEQLVFSKFERQIVDVIFKFIENDRELFNAYQDLLSEKDSGQLRYTNSVISQSIAERYSLVKIENPEPDELPESKLIQSYTKLRR